jgi:hypothetical protein
MHVRARTRTACAKRCCRGEGGEREEEEETGRKGGGERKWKCGVWTERKRETVMPASI